MRERRALVAAGTTTLGVVLIWAFAALRQEGQTQELARQWVGQEWDIARRCLVGTPIGRRDAEAQVADRLAALALDALAEPASRDAPASARWPARCAPRLVSLRVDASVTGVDLSHHVGQIDALARHVLEPRDPAGTLARARALAAPIHALDLAMPPGATHDPSAYPAPRADARAIEASLACAQEDAAPSTSPCGGEARLDLEVTPAVWSRDGAPIPFDPPLPAGATPSVACDAERAVVLWRVDGAWEGTRCEATCAPLPPLPAGEALEVALVEGRVVVVAREAPGGLSFARALRDEEWTDPVLVPRGRLAPDAPAIEACGERWTFATP
ncbi:MAG: hypothetical protein KF729_28590 [Sandaracinaceae bacterium]|nr:hypothetical protein [Sandaracinaceae bacterium]